MKQTTQTGGGAAKPARPKPQERRLASYNLGLERLMGREGRPVIDVALLALRELRMVMQKPRGTSETAYTRQVRQALGAGVRIERLFPDCRDGVDLPGLRDFFLVRWPGLDPAMLAAHPHDIAYALQDATKSVSATPEASASAGAPNTCREARSRPNPARQGPGAGIDSADWQLHAVNQPAARQLLAGRGMDDGAAGIVVGHIDTGIIGHRLLDGRVNFAGGTDFLRPGSPPVDPLPADDLWGDVAGHGTLSSSVLGASPDDGITRFAGVAHGVTLLPMRVTRNVVIGPESASFVARAIVSATAGGADLISISLGGFPLSPSLHWAVNNATKNNVMVIAAAGQCVKFTTMPAALRNAVAVAGSKMSSTRAAADSFEAIRDRLTLWGPASSGLKIAIAAPAKDITAAFHDDPPATPPALNRRLADKLQGTTFATAMVAGAAALWLRRHRRDSLARRYGGWMSLTTVFKKLLADSAYVPPGWLPNWGPGVLDIEALLEQPLPTLAPGLDIPMPGLMAQYDRLDVVEWFEDFFCQFRPEDVRAALRRLFPAGDEAQWREQLERFGAEALARLAANEQAAGEFAQAIRAQAQASVQEAAERAAEAARAIAEQCSQRLRQVLPS